MPGAFADNWAARLVREAAARFVRASNPAALALWVRMPAGWTAASDLVRDGEHQSTVSTRLALLRKAGAVETWRDGRSVRYRPRNQMRVEAILERREGS